MRDQGQNARRCARCGALLSAEVDAEVCAQCAASERPGVPCNAQLPGEFSDTHPTEASEAVGEETVVSEGAQPEFSVLPKDWRPALGGESTLDDVTRELRQVRARLPEHSAEWRSLGSLSAAEQMLVGFKVGLGVVLAVLLAAVVLLGIGLALSVVGFVDWGKIFETLLGR